jgi:hypothetical protein
MKFGKKYLLILTIFLFSVSGLASAANYCVRDGASGSNDGSDWTDAYTDLPSTLERGSTYYIADGSYNGYTFDDSPSATYITVKKATASDHGTGTGWQSSYGDGTAFFGNCNFSSTSYVIFDGQVEDGFTLTKEGEGGTVVTISSSNHITVRNCDLDGNFATLSGGEPTSHTNGACHVLHLGTVSYVTIENCKLHNVADDGMEIHGADNLSIVGNQVYNLYGCGTDGGCGDCYNGHSDGIEIFNVENSEFKENLVYDVRSTSAFISGNWTTDPNNDSWNVTLINNIFYSPETGFCIYIDETHNVELTHNVFWGIKQGSYGGLSMGPNVTDMDMYNNIILSINYSHMGATYDSDEHRGDYNLFGYDTGQYPLQTNDIIDSDPNFENIPDIYGPADRTVTAEDFRLTSASSAIDDGTNMGITVDFFGNTRPQGSGYDMGAHEYGAAPDTTPPSPDPMTWSTDPYATGDTSISMTATTATDVSGVEYYFDCITSGGHDSGWQNGTTYEDTGLSASTQYTYQVKARDKSTNQNETAYSTTKSATTNAADTTAPSPDPMMWATEPNATGTSSISMTATTATDTSGVEYYFDETSGNPGGSDSGWQDSTTYQDAGLDANTTYTYRVKARDKSSNQNATSYSTSKSATTGSGGGEPNDIVGHTDDTGVYSDGQLLWIGGGSRRVGGAESGGRDECVVYVFELPTLTSGQSIVDANLSFYLESYSYYSPAGNVDLYGIAYRSSSSVQSDDWYQGAYDGDPNATALQNNIMTPSSPEETTINTSSSGDNALKAYLNAQYDGGAEGGDYVFIRVNADSNETNTPQKYWVVSMANNATASQRPVLTVTIESAGDTTAPSPDPMTWATDPYATGTTSISMTATTATDTSGVEYYFDETSGNPGGSDSGWQDSATYEDTGLSASTQYTYKVKARDKSSNQNETAYSTSKSATTDATPDTTPPSPDPMTWATDPYATGASSISMTATTATDASGVEYYFDCTAGGGNDSGWQDSTTYQDTGLSELTQYTYRVKARDKSSNQNETAYSTTKSATTEDGTAPSPDPMTWATEPYSTGTTSISMTATTATDASGVEYYFECIAGGGNSSGWQDSATYEDTGLSELTEYTYRVKARDKSSNQNETGYSTTKSATTEDGTVPSPDPMTWATEPYSTGTSSISMTATTATDASGVEYYFDCTAGGGNDSGWQDSTTYEDTALSPETQYTYRVKARDKSGNQNETGYSTSKSATTDAEAESNLVSWWKLDESSGTGADDSSGNNHDGTRSGGSWAPTSGKFDGAVDLGAANSDHVEIPTTGMSASTGTVSLWGRLEGTQSGKRFFFGHTSTPGSWVNRIQLYMNSGDNQLDLGLGDSHSRYTNIQTLSAGTWYHIALTWDGSNYIVYVDGISKASGTYTGLSTLGSYADVGNNGGNTAARIEAFQGLLDEVRIYDAALSKYDIADLAGITIASDPSPANSVTDVSTTADLSWSAGYYAADVNGHDVYLGTDYNSVADANHSSAEFKGNQSFITYDPGTMDANTTYYWAIDEVNDSNTWLGEVWSFTTAAAAADIEFDAVSSNSSNVNGTTLSWSHTIGSGDDRILIVGISGEDSSSSDLSISSVKYNNVSMSLVTGSSATAGTSTLIKTELYYMLETDLPSSGAYTATVTYSGSVSSRTGGAISLVNVEQQAAEAVATNTVTSQAAISTNITTLTDGAWVVDTVGCGNPSSGYTTTTSGMVERYDESSGYSSGAGSTKAVSTAGSTTMSWLYGGVGNRQALSVAAFAVVE